MRNPASPRNGPSTVHQAPIARSPPRDTHYACRRANFVPTPKPPRALDDKIHLIPARRARDKFLGDACRRAGLPLIRVKTAQRYDVDEIRETVKAHLPKGATQVRPNDPLAQLKGGKTPGWVFKRVGRSA